jgi:hypothetical protein
MKGKNEKCKRKLTETKKKQKNVINLKPDKENRKKNTKKPSKKVTKRKYFRGEKNCSDQKKQRGEKWVSPNTRAGKEN